MPTLLSDKYEARKAEVNARFEQLRANEEELNRIFAKIYNMEGEVPIEVEDKYVSVARIFDTAEEIPESYKGNKYVRTKRDEITSLISYAVGCMFGRYSLDVDGLVLADQGATVADYLDKMPDPAHVTFMPDADNVLPITDDEYFDDDIVRYFIDFVRTVYGEETLEQNLAFIAEALGGRGAFARGDSQLLFEGLLLRTTARRIRSAPSTGFSIRVRRPASERLSTCIAIRLTCLRAFVPITCMSSRSAIARRSAMPRTHLPRLKKGEKVVLTKRIKKLKEQLTETIAYEEKLHHLADQMIKIDLDDGVKVNYAQIPGCPGKD